MVRCSSYNLRRNNNGVLLRYLLAYSKKTLGNRSFSCVAPKLWNNLPFEIRCSNSIVSFKSQLKTFLFKKAFQWYSSIFMSISIYLLYINLVYTLWCAFEYCVYRICALQNKVIIVINQSQTDVKKWCRLSSLNLRLKALISEVTVVQQILTLVCYVSVALIWKIQNRKRIFTSDLWHWRALRDLA